MVYIQSWQEYQEQAEQLYTASPTKTRYCIKWRASEGKLVLKITDDTRCIKFKTTSALFLNRFEVLNQEIMAKMSNRKPPPPPPTTAAPITTAPTVTAGTEGGVKKKNKKKKK